MRHEWGKGDVLSIRWHSVFPYFVSALSVMIYTPLFENVKQEILVENSQFLLAV